MESNKAAGSAISPDESTALHSSFTSDNSPENTKSIPDKSDFSQLKNRSRSIMLRRKMLLARHLSLKDLEIPRDCSGEKEHHITELRQRSNSQSKADSRPWHNRPALIPSQSRNSALNGLKEQSTSGILRPQISLPDNKRAFADIAKTLVSTKRAAKGFMHLWTTEAQSPSAVYKGIHMEEKKLNLISVASEHKEMKRRQFYQELVVYVVFLTLLFRLLAWLPVEESYQQNNVLGDITCREKDVCDIQSLPSVYDFAMRIQGRLCERLSDQEANGSIQGAAMKIQWIRVGGVHLRQVRVKLQDCQVVPGYNTPCYPNYSTKNEDRSDFHGKNDGIYHWRDGLRLLSPDAYHQAGLFSIGTATYGTGGYLLDLCKTSIEKLQDDTWLSIATRAVSLNFLLFNPVTRMFTVGSHVFTISPSGHLDHYPRSVNLRVLGLENLIAGEENSYKSCTTALCQRKERWIESAMWWLDRRFFVWIAVVLFWIMYCFGEWSEISTMGLGTYLTTDLWNAFETIHLAVVCCLLLQMMQYLMTSSSFVREFKALSLDTLDEDQQSIHEASQLLLISFQRFCDFASAASAVSFLRIFKFLRMNSTLNLLWRVLGMAMRDLMGFLVIFNLIFLGYSFMGYYAFGFALEEFSTLSKSYATCFHMLAGEVDYPRLRQANPRLAPIFLVTFIVLVFQVLVNMFVAILSEYYEFAKHAGSNSSSEEKDPPVSGIEFSSDTPTVNPLTEDDVEYDVMARIRRFIQSCAPRVVTKKNQVIRLRPDQRVRLISTNLVDQEETRRRVSKLFRCAVWRIVALLRFGMKFDRRLNLAPRNKTQPASGSSSTVGESGEEKNASDSNAATYICLSDDFDHKAIMEMIPIGITVSLLGDSVMDNGIALKVVRHNKLSVECLVLKNDQEEELCTDSNSRGNRSHSTTSENILELLGGEKLCIPWTLFARHIFKNIYIEIRDCLMRATKLWYFYGTKDSNSRPYLDDYRLLRLLTKLRAEGVQNLRFDEVVRVLDIYLRKNRRSSTCSQARIREEALKIMYRFRRSLIDMPSREKEGYNYHPKPVDTSAIDLGPLSHIADMLAKNTHDMWAFERLKQGWEYGEYRSDAEKKHPNLVPFETLPIDEQNFDYRSSMETIKTILFMNYSIIRMNKTESLAEAIARSSSHRESFSMGSIHSEDSASELELADNGCQDTPSAAVLRQLSLSTQSSHPDIFLFSTYGPDRTQIYRPMPIDTSGIELPPHLIHLLDLLAENAHEVWSKGRMDEGWVYGPQRDDINKKHPCLVPYVFLTEAEKEYDLNIAIETLKTLLAMDFTLVERAR